MIKNFSRFLLVRRMVEVIGGGTEGLGLSCPELFNDDGTFTELDLVGEYGWGVEYDDTEKDTGGDWVDIEAREHGIEGEHDDRETKEREVVGKRVGEHEIWGVNEVIKFADDSSVTDNCDAMFT